MPTTEALQAIDTNLRDKLMARLAMRWPKAATYMPAGSTRVHCAQPLPEGEQAPLDMYILAYQDAINDILGIVDSSGTQPEPPLALRMAENSVFQGGSMPQRTGPKHGHWLGKPAEGRSGRRDPEARKRLEDLFCGGGK